MSHVVTGGCQVATGGYTRTPGPAASVLRTQKRDHVVTGGYIRWLQVVTHALPLLLKRDHVRCLRCLG